MIMRLEWLRLSASETSGELEISRGPLSHVHDFCPSPAVQGRPSSIYCSQARLNVEVLSPWRSLFKSR